MEKIRHDRTPIQSRSWAGKLSSLLGCLFLLVVTYRLLLYLFRQSGKLNRSWSNSQENLEQLEQAVELELCYKENRKLAEIWSLSDKSGVLFIALDLRTCHDNERIITDIGISPWSPGNKSYFKSYHLFIDRHEQQDDAVLSGVGAFPYGNIQLIDESDIGPCVSDKLNSVSLGYETICLVGHDVSNKIKYLKPYWEVPSGTCILDTQKIWKAQNRNINDTPLERCLLGIPDLERKRLSSGVGNRSRAIIQLLQAQGPRSTSTKIKSSNRIKGNISEPPHESAISTLALHGN